MEEFKVPTVTAKHPESDISVAIPEPSINSTVANKKHSVSNSPQIVSGGDTKCPYNEPKWSCTPNPNNQYKFEVLKSGTIVEEIDNLQKKPFWLFGRLSQNDMVMAHPTISRYHAVLQYRTAPKSPTESEKTRSETLNAANIDRTFGEGWYLYDLGSTHGSFVNKMRIPPQTYIPVKVGHMITLGASTRKYILQGPEFDEEPESELTVTELRERRAMEEEARKRYSDMQEELREKEGIDWGMSEDADEETDLNVNPYASTNNEELFLDDPKKTLRGFFEREGLDLEYNVDEMSLGTFVCRIELPLDDAEGKAITAEVCHKGKKKECVLQCALEACRILDRHGVLRQSHHEPMKRKAPKSDSDDEDDFLDRTGDVEKKKMRKANAGQTATLTYEDLLKQEAELSEKMSTIDEKIRRYQEETKRSKQKESQASEDDLDDYMNSLSYEKEIDKAEIRKLRLEEQRLLSEHQKLQRLIKITKPTQMPSIVNPSDSQTKKKLLLPLFGKRNKSKFKMFNKTAPTRTVTKNDHRSDEEEIEDDETKEVSSESPSTNENGGSCNNDDYSSKTDTLLIAKDKNIASSSDIVKAVKGPAFIPHEFTTINQKSSPPTLQDDESTKAVELMQEAEKDEPDEEENYRDECAVSEEVNNANKKRRNRNRHRAKGRENVDIDDKAELTDREKYSGWVPPQNQTGDGITSLNEKFGY